MCKIFFRLSFFAAVILSGHAFAQSQPVWSHDYSPSNQVSKPGYSPPPVAQASPVFMPRSAQRPQPRSSQLRDPSAAWARQWGPVQDLTGISSGTARNFIQGVRQRYIEDSKTVLSNARDWAVILGDSGLVGSVTESTGDWFGYVTDDIPAALGSGVMGSSLMGGSGGFNYFPSYPSE